DSASPPFDGFALGSNDPVWRGRRYRGLLPLPFRGIQITSSEHSPPIGGDAPRTIRPSTSSPRLIRGGSSRSAATAWSTPVRLVPLVHTKMAASARIFPPHRRKSPLPAARLAWRWKPL